MPRRRFIPCLFALLVLGVYLWADSKPDAKPAGQQPITPENRMLLIRSLNAEFVWVRHVFPMGTKGLVLKNGAISPSDQEIQQMVAQNGMAAKPGDRAQITSVEFKDNKIIFEINGGAKKKTKWYQRISVSGMGGTAQLPDDAAKQAQGSYVELQFDKFIPNLTGDEIRQMLAPVFDFKSLSAAEAYLDTVPPKVKEAIKNHEVLVGMNRQMVTYAKGRPVKKIREADAQGKPYEEWLYGEPPQEVQFVRFEGDQVVRLEIMKVDGEKIVRTEKEVDLPTAVAEKKDETSKPPAKAPSLRRPGEEPEVQLPEGQSVPVANPMPPAPKPVPPGPGPTPNPGGPG